MNNNRGAQTTEDDHTGEVRTRFSKIWLREDGIIQMVFDPGSEFTLTDTRESLECIVKLSKGKRYPLLVDMRDIKSADYGARQEAATFEDAISLAALISSPVSRMIGNVFLTLYKIAYPIRLFTSEAEAIEWLKGFLK